MNKRDRKLLRYLEKFRVLSRDQVGRLVCAETKNPPATATRICKRLARDEFLTIVIPQFRMNQYVYMPNPTLIHPHSKHLFHYLNIADIFIELNQPEHFEVEPQFNNDYRPDFYTTLGIPVIGEVQRTRISNKLMQEKVDLFMKSFYKKEHQAQILWIYCSEPYKLDVEPGFQILQGLDIFSPIFSLA